MTGGILGSRCGVCGFYFPIILRRELGKQRGMDNKAVPGYCRDDNEENKLLLGLLLWRSTTPLKVCLIITPVSQVLLVYSRAHSGQLVFALSVKLWGDLRSRLTSPEELTNSFQMLHSPATSSASNR